MTGLTPKRMRKLLERWQGALSGAGRGALMELALCFTTLDGKLAAEPFVLIQEMASVLGMDSPTPDQAKDEAPEQLLHWVQELKLSGDEARVVVNCLFLIGVVRGALTAEQRQILATVAGAGGIPTEELNTIAQSAIKLARGDEPAGDAKAPFAIVSDIHSNRAALKTTLRDIEKQGVSRIVCLGDVVGYGPDPIACVDLIRTRCAFTLMGNHDIALFEGAKQFNKAAKGAIDWTRQKLQIDQQSPQTRDRWRFLKNLPLQLEEDGSLFVHGSPRDPWREYIFPDEARLPQARAKFKEIFKQLDRFLFVGHTHLPCVITQEGFVATSKKLDNEWTRPEGVRAIVNVGSVGQPRDRDPRACYLIVDGDTVRWRRLPYPNTETIERIRANPHLEDVLAIRLAKGA